MPEETQDNIMYIEPTRLVINRVLLDCLLWDGIPEAVQHKIAKRTNHSRNHKFAYQVLITLSDVFPMDGEVISVDGDIVQIEWRLSMAFISIKHVLRFIDKNLYKLTARMDYGENLSEGTYGDTKHE